MSEQMPRIWWVPQWGLWATHGGGVGTTVHPLAVLAADCEMPADAVELHPVSGDTETEWAMRTVDFIDEREFQLSATSEEHARHFCSPGDRVVRRSVSEWEEVRDE